MTNKNKRFLTYSNYTDLSSYGATKGWHEASCHQRI